MEKAGLKPNQVLYYRNNCHLQVKTASKYVCLNESIEVTCSVVDKESGTLQNFSNAAQSGITVHLQDDANQEYMPAAATFATSPSPCSFTNGQASFSIVLSESFKPIGSRIRIKVSIMLGGRESDSMHASSSSLILCRGSLSLLNNVPEKWFKDEGGKSNCIPLEVVLNCKDKARFHNIESIPLHATLLYENGEVVPIEDILHPKENMALPTFGKSLIQFKVAHCSQSHQGKRFKIQLAPDLRAQPELSDIQPVITNAFRVKSKRRKVKPEFGTQVRSAKRARTDWGQGTTQEPPPLPAGGGGLLRPFPPLGAAPPLAAGDGRGPPPAPAPGTGRGELMAILNWVSGTLSTLQALQWEHAGFALDGEGRPDRAAPLYKCPGCKKFREPALGQAGVHTQTCPIASALNGYTASVRPLFLSLASRVERWEKGAAAPAPAAAAMPTPPVPAADAAAPKQPPAPAGRAAVMITPVDDHEGHPPEMTAPPAGSGGGGGPRGLGRRISDALLRSPAFQRRLSGALTEFAGLREEELLEELGCAPSFPGGLGLERAGSLGLGLGLGFPPSRGVSLGLDVGGAVDVTTAAAAGGAGIDIDDNDGVVAPVGF